MSLIEKIQKIQFPHEERFIDHKKIDQHYVFDRNVSNINHMFFMKYGEIPSVTDLWIPINRLDDFLKYLLEKEYKIIHIASTFNRFPSYSVMFHKNRIILEVDQGNSPSTLDVEEMEESMDGKSVAINVSYLTSELSEILEIQNTFGVKFNMVEKNKVLLFEKNEYNEIVLNAHKVKTFDLDINENYNNDFEEVHHKMLNWMNDFSMSNNRLVLFHGIPGAGKTNYLKYLLSVPSDVKKIYLSPSFIQLMADPSFIPILRREKKSILIIEDAEKILSRREDNADNSIISTLLNMCDGIMGDVLDFKIIATFNVDEDRIDDALKRQGRLFLKYKFDALSEDKTKKLYEKVHNKLPIKKKMTLAEIYNEKNDFSNKEEERRMGFMI